MLVECARHSEILPTSRSLGQDERRPADSEVRLASETRLAPRVCPVSYPVAPLLLFFSVAMAAVLPHFLARRRNGVSRSLIRLRMLGCFGAALLFTAGE